MRVRDHRLLEVRLDAGAPAAVRRDELDLDARAVLRRSHSTVSSFDDVGLVALRVDADAHAERGAALAGLRHDDDGLAGGELGVQAGGADADALLAARVVTREQAIARDEVLATGDREVVHVAVFALDARDAFDFQEAHVGVGDASDVRDELAQLGDLLGRDVGGVVRSEVPHLYECFARCRVTRPRAMRESAWQVVGRPHLGRSDDPVALARARGTESEAHRANHGLGVRRDALALCADREERLREHRVAVRLISRRATLEHT